MENAIQIVGWIGVSIIFCAYSSQLVKYLYTKNYKGISLTTFLLPVLGCLIWIIYGALDNDEVIAFSNIAFATVIIVLFYLTAKNIEWFKPYFLITIIFLVTGLITVSVIAILNVVDSEIDNIFQTENAAIKYILSISAGLLISVKLVPQAWKTYRSKYARSLSLPFLSLLMLGNILRFCYSLMIYIENDNLSSTLGPMIFFLFAAVMSSILLSLKLTFNKNAHPVKLTNKSTTKNEEITYAQPIISE